MSGQTVHSGPAQTTLPDYLNLAANVVYAGAGLLFVAGLYADWKLPGQNFIPMFMLADEPHANSGLFILSIILLLVGYTISRGADYVVEWQTESVDQTQEWTVDVGESK